MATVTTQRVGLDGAALTYSAASGGGDKFTPGAHTFLHIVNASGVSVTATITTPDTVEGNAIADRAVVLAAGVNRLVRVPATVFANRADSGLAAIAWSATTSVTFAVLEA